MSTKKMLQECNISLFLRSMNPLNEGDGDSPLISQRDIPPTYRLLPWLRRFARDVLWLVLLHQGDRNRVSHYPLTVHLFGGDHWKTLAVRVLLLDFAWGF